MENLLSQVVEGTPNVMSQIQKKLNCIVRYRERAIVIHTLNLHLSIPPTLHRCHPYFELVQVQSMDDKCGEWVESMDVASECRFKEVQCIC